MNQYDFPIDLVYLWCDDTDEVWRAKKQQHLLVENKLDSQSTNDCRFANNDELKYSLRSVAKYAPWINHIYIVSDHQTPNWLNTDHPKITMINHEDILPKENLPLFNSEAIETALAKIPNLSEHFLFANDDMFFGNDVKPQDFFTKNGKVIVRLTPNPKKAKIAKSQYSQHIDAMQKLIFNTFATNFKYQPHHNIDSYLKSEFQNCINNFGELSSATAKQRFRQEPAFQRSIIGYWMICKKCGIQKNIKKWKSQLLDIIPPFSKLIKQDSISINISSDKGLQKLWRIKPKMFCLNDCEKTTENNRQNIKQFMEKLFPSKSEFEKIEQTSKISVIVPVYNVEQYLPQCLDSIIKQTYKNLEIICVDDGSPDNSGKILDEYAKKDKRIKVIHQKNGGVSIARNTGLDNATGEYIGFVDPDDWIEANYYETLIRSAKDNNADVVQCGYTIFKNSSYEKVVWKETVATSFKDIIDGLKRGYIWNKLWKNDFIKKNNLRFNTQIHYCEDLLFAIEAILIIEKFNIINNCGYYYRHNMTSVTNTASFKQKRRNNSYDVCKQSLSKLKNKNKIKIVKTFLVSQLFSPNTLKDQNVYIEANKILGYTPSLIKNRFIAIRRSFFRFSLKNREITMLGKKYNW